MMPPSTVPSGLPSEPMTMTANDVTVASTPIAGVIEPSMKGAKTPAMAASADADRQRRWPKRDGRRCRSQTASSRSAITARVR